MSPDSRQETEAQADRLLRRGEPAAALALLRALLTLHPQEQSLRSKVESLESSLLPEERSAPKLDASERPLSGSDPRIEQAERLAARGDYPSAIALYRGALQQRPDHQLLRERVSELYGLAQAAPRPTPSPTPHRNAESWLHALLERISVRRKA